MTIIKHEKNAAGDDIPVDDMVYRSKSKQQSTININIANEKAQDLTEQWKNGELEWDREYYVDLDNSGKIKQLYLDEDGDFFDGMIDYSLKNKPYMEVLAPVPSYEEWEQLQNWADFTNDYHELREKLEIAEYKNAELNERIEKLEKLLKECKEAIEKAQKNYGYDDSIVEILEPVTNKIDEALQ